MPADHRHGITHRDTQDQHTILAPYGTILKYVTGVRLVYGLSTVRSCRWGIWS